TAPRLVTPAERAVGEHVQERGAVDGGCALGLHAQVVPVRRGALRDVRDVVADRDRGPVLAPLRLAEAPPAGRARRRRGAERGRAGALDARVHVRLVVVTDEQEAVAAL